MPFRRKNTGEDWNEVSVDLSTVSVMDKLNSLKTTLEVVVTRLEAQVGMQRTSNEARGKNFNE